MDEMREHFYRLADEVTDAVTGEEILLLNLGGESSDFVRFNHGLIRQGGAVQQSYLTVHLVEGQRHATGTISLSGQEELDVPQARDLLEDLRGLLPTLPEDPYLLINTEPEDTEVYGEDNLPSPGHAISAIRAAGNDRDLVGIYAAGQIYRGFANSLGQRNWMSTHSFHFDWCFYLQADKAVKTSYAGFSWDEDEFARKVDTAASQLEILRQPARSIEPGKYRVYLAPPAVEELVGMLGWGGFGLKAHKTKTTSLLRMIEGGATLDPRVTLMENTRKGLAPNFQSEGFIKPPEVVLIREGACADCLVSPRSAREYDVPPNAGSESPQSLDLAGGDIPVADVLEHLDTGIYLNQLWYCNYSDMPAGRITGMSRFASFWVEHGQILAPLNVMRFDETIYNALGANLVGLTAERDFLPSSQTYSGRSVDSARMPGAIIDEFTFTL